MVPTWSSSSQHLRARAEGPQDWKPGARFWIGLRVVLKAGPLPPAALHPALTLLHPALCSRARLGGSSWGVPPVESPGGGTERGDGAFISPPLPDPRHVASSRVTSSVKMADSPRLCSQSPSPPPAFSPLDPRTGTLVSSAASGDCTRFPGTLPRALYGEQVPGRRKIILLHFLNLWLFFFLAACGIFPDQESEYAPHWKAWSQPLDHQGKPGIILVLSFYLLPLWTVPESPDMQIHKRETPGVERRPWRVETPRGCGGLLGNSEDSETTVAWASRRPCCCCLVTQLCLESLCYGR